MSKKVTKTIFVCGGDWRHEMGDPDIKGKLHYFNSLKSLKKDCKCWEECGIVKLKVTFESWEVEEQPINEFMNNMTDLIKDELKD